MLLCFFPRRLLRIANIPGTGRDILLTPTGGTATTIIATGIGTTPGTTVTSDITTRAGTASDITIIIQGILALTSIGTIVGIGAGEISCS